MRTTPHRLTLTTAQEDPVARFHQPPAQIDPAEAHRLATAGEALLLDVREPAEYAEVHAPGAVLVPLGSLDGFGSSAGADGPDAEGPLVLALCRSGNRSQVATDVLNARGVRTVNVTGGMRAWLEAGLPSHQGACPCGTAI
ncbi:rhodanese-like domain-containing protein [Kitasatospora cheerisanensis]|uniref:rhodanese-like domain-containing protein n=1 Tax=Kitasatospora cheerisanensis TaxID=81942 RepID=UPI000A46FAA5|nr:rhodanese-like domain-containing protein [Kitasatospora cheerisanensis]